MTASHPPPPRLLKRTSATPATVCTELLKGLSAPTAAVSPKYLYDALGSRLFAAITELPEYYPTRTEAAILRAHLAAMAKDLAPVDVMVDLGAATCEKAASLFEAFSVRRYVAVDIAVDVLRASLDRLRIEHPGVELLGIGCDFSTALDLPAEIGEGPRLMFYPGSSIGNFTPDEALKFLRNLCAASQGGALLIGVDLVKPVPILEAAYDDPLQVTAAFNRNLLRHVNRLTGADFSLCDWRHVAFFNAEVSRIEMHLEAVRQVRVTWPEGTRVFAEGERIHTENSYKWHIEEFGALLRQAGFDRVQHWTDAHHWFAVFAAHA